MRAFVSAGADTDIDPYTPLEDAGDGTLTPQDTGEVVAYFASEETVTVDDETIRHTVEVA